MFSQIVSKEEEVSNLSTSELCCLPTSREEFNIPQTRILERKRDKPRFSQEWEHSGEIVIR